MSKESTGSSFCSALAIAGKECLSVKKSFLRWLALMCYVQQCWLISTLLLEVSRGIVSYIILFILGALQYTTLIFGFPSLCMLRQNRNGVTKIYNYKPLLLLLHFSTFTIPLYINAHLTVKASLWVPPLLTSNLSSLM